MVSFWYPETVKEYHYYDGHGMTFDEAIAYCSSNGWSLAVPETEAEWGSLLR